MDITITNTWANLLAEEMQKDYFRSLWKFVEHEYDTNTCYPPADKIFAALNECPPDKVKAVILGQDPYHEEGQAEGLCFSCNLRRWPPSLKNILREVSDDTGAPLPPNGSLLRWAKQGVLLLNATLTVRQGHANSHSGHGWELFTDAVISKASNHCTHTVFFLWGNYAQKKASLIDGTKHLILQSPHPSPLSAHRGFFGTHQFSKANDFLRAHGLEEIIW